MVADLLMVAFSQSVGSVSCSSRLSSSATVETFLSSMRSTIPGIVVQRAGPEAEKCSFLGFAGFRLHRHRMQEPCQWPQLYLVTVEKSPETIKEKQEKVSVTELALNMSVYMLLSFFAALKLFRELEYATDYRGCQWFYYLPLSGFWPWWGRHTESLFGRKPWRQT